MGSLGPGVPNHELRTHGVNKHDRVVFVFAPSFVQFEWFRVEGQGSRPEPWSCQFVLLVLREGRNETLQTIQLVVSFKGTRKKIIPQRQRSQAVSYRPGLSQVPTWVWVKIIPQRDRRFGFSPCFLSQGSVLGTYFDPHPH